MDEGLPTSRYRRGWIPLLIVALLVLLAQAVHAGEWHPVDTTDDGIEIFRKEAGDRLVAFRGVGIVEAPLPLVATVIFDTDRRLEWIEGLVESRILRWGGRDNFVEYDHIDMPIFFTDRDFVSKITMSFEPPGKMTFHYEPENDPSAPTAGYIRGELIETTFILISLENGKRTQIDAKFLSDPKGRIPKWLVNFFVKGWPKKTFRNLRTELKKPGLSADPRFSELLPGESIGLRE
ncbi:MAG: START domain-containing protein [Nitrospirota bacterium]